MMAFATRPVQSCQFIDLANIPARWRRSMFAKDSAQEALAHVCEKPFP
jgi:hypothetical protein